LLIDAMLLLFYFKNFWFFNFILFLLLKPGIAEKEKKWSTQAKFPFIIELVV